MRDECGVFGVISPENKKVGNITYFGLYALQHRGQESAGIAVSDGVENISFYKNMGLVSKVFSQEILSELTGKSAIGHVRYSTSGKSSVDNAQPLISTFKYGMVALAHNGNITNALELKKLLEKDGAIFRSDSDSEVLLHLIARNKNEDFIEALKEEACKLKGAYSIVILYKDKLIALKDRSSIRPLCIGKLRKKYIVSSESCALDMIGAEYIRELEAGEIVIVDTQGNVRSEIYDRTGKREICSFEYIYFSRPDTVFFDESVHVLRKKMGNMLAKKYPVEADVVIPVPDSGIAAALGYSETSKIPYDKGIIRNHYIGRTFIQPMQELRNMKVKMKLNPVSRIIKDKRVVLIDDSIVRGTTSKQLVTLLKSAGAKEIHLRICSPMVINSCKLGIDTPTRDELIASKMNKEQICEYLGATSCEYLELKNLKKCLKEDGYCYRCFQEGYSE